MRGGGHPEILWSAGNLTQSAKPLIWQAVPHDWQIGTEKRARVLPSTRPGGRSRRLVLPEALLSSDAGWVARAVGPRLFAIALPVPCAPSFLVDPFPEDLPQASPGGRARLACRWSVGLEGLRDGAGLVPRLESAGTKNPACGSEMKTLCLISDHHQTGRMDHGRACGSC
jgi:hypothetical protein